MAFFQREKKKTQEELLRSNRLAGRCLVPVARVVCRIAIFSAFTYSLAIFRSFFFILGIDDRCNKEAVG